MCMSSLQSCSHAKVFGTTMFREKCLDLARSIILLHCLGKHKLAHPLNAVAAALDSEVMALSRLVEEVFVLLVFWDETESERWLSAGAAHGSLECGVKL